MELEKQVTYVMDKVRKTRQRKSMSQLELAQKAEISQSFLASLESGKKQPSVLTIIKIANALEINPGELFPIIISNKEQTKEDWSEYTLENGTVIKIKQVVVQIIKLDETDEQGNPSYVTQIQPIVSVIHSKG